MTCSASQSQSGQEHFKEVEAQSGIDLRNDWQRHCGVCFALDGPILPTRVEVVAEVYDTDHLQQMIEKVPKMATIT
jgi:hypothetical protein